MDFLNLAQTRQSCRSYDSQRPIEEEKLNAILRCAQLAPSACNGQPYHITVCRGEKAKVAAQAVSLMGMNKFAVQAPVLLAISEEAYVRSAAVGAKLKNNDYRSMDIGILAAFITSEAASLGLGSCILGWLDDEKLRNVCGVKNPVRLAITLGYPGEKDQFREKKRKDIQELVSIIE